MNIEGRIMQSLRPRKDGVLFRSDIERFGSPSQVSSALRSLREKRLVIRLAPGVYAKPTTVSNVQDLKAFVSVIVERRRQLMAPKRARRSRTLTRTARRVRSLADKAGVQFRPTYADIWARSVTRLAGDDVRPDATDNLLVALGRAKAIPDSEVLSLLLAHHNELKGL